MKDKNVSRKGRYALIASLTTSFLLVILFAALSAAVNNSRATPLYTQVDIIAGMIFVFVLSMIVSASVWPAVIEKRMKGR
jgi:Na+-transporting NADH:ubiquinone oxidoreductase subunit NqrB